MSAQLHSHHHHGHKSLGQRNQEHFDEIASTAFQTPWIAKITTQVSHELSRNYAWINKGRRTERSDTKLLDYACGNGVVSRALAPYVTTCRGIDISSEMVAQYHKVAAEEGLSKETMSAVHGDLLTSPTSEELDTPEYKGFDLAVISLALHHVEDVDAMIARLVERLDDGGVLVVVDWVAESESGCKLEVREFPARDTVRCMGFAEEQLRKSFQKAGLGGWGWTWFDERSEIPREYGGQQQGFLARGTKGAGGRM